MIKSHKKLRICVGASAGGHMNQLLKLLEKSEGWLEPPSFCVTSLKILAEKLTHFGPVYITGECDRQHCLKALLVLLRSSRIILSERPGVVVTTGSLPMALFCFVAKLFDAKIVWIDSIANVECFSWSGRVVRYIADLFLTQWPELAGKYKNVEYAGAIV